MSKTRMVGTAAFECGIATMADNVAPSGVRMSSSLTPLAAGPHERTSASANKLGERIWGRTLGKVRLNVHHRPHPRAHAGHDAADHRAPGCRARSDHRPARRGAAVEGRAATGPNYRGRWAADARLRPVRSRGLHRSRVLAQGRPAAES